MKAITAYGEGGAAFKGSLKDGRGLRSKRNGRQGMKDKKDL